MARDDQSIELAAGLHNVNGAVAFHLELFGDDLAEQEGYHEHKGLDAIRFYRMHKYGWLPRDVRLMSIDDLDFAVTELRKGWTVPKATRGVYLGL